MRTCIELRDLDHHVLVVDQRDLSLWTSRGYAVVTRKELMFAMRDVLRLASRRQLSQLWLALYYVGLPERLEEHIIKGELTRAASGHLPRLQILHRKIKRGSLSGPMQWIKREGTPRLDTEHYIVVQAVDKDEKPVVGVQLELVIAGGEVKGAATGQDGFARVERIHAGSVVVRVLNVDGSMWKALDGAPSQPSSSDERVRWHVVGFGRESLGDVAKQYGIKDWKTIWDHPKNQALRKKRKRPAALRRGDQVALPALNISESVRSTDATHRIVIERHDPMLRLTWSV